MKKLKPAPRAFRGELPPDYPGPLPAYKVQTLLEEYRGLAIVFGVLALALAAYFVKSILSAPPPPPAPPPPSVYVEMVPPQPTLPDVKTPPPR